MKQIKSRYQASAYPRPIRPHGGFKRRRPLNVLGFPVPAACWRNDRKWSRSRIIALFKARAHAIEGVNKQPC